MRRVLWGGGVDTLAISLATPDNSSAIIALGCGVGQSARPHTSPGPAPNLARPRPTQPGPSSPCPQPQHAWQASAVLLFWERPGIPRPSWAIGDNGHGALSKQRRADNLTHSRIPPRVRPVTAAATPPSIKPSEGLTRLLIAHEGLRDFIKRHYGEQCVVRRENITVV